MCISHLCFAIVHSWAISLIPHFVSPSFLPFTLFYCKIRLYSSLQQANCVRYLFSLQNCWINKLILMSYQLGDKLFGNRRLGSQDILQPRFSNYSSEEEVWCGALLSPPQIWANMHTHTLHMKTCKYLHTQCIAWAMGKLMTTDDIITIPIMIRDVSLLEMIT